MVPKGVRLVLTKVINSVINSRVGVRTAVRADWTIEIAWTVSTLRIRNNMVKESKFWEKKMTDIKNKQTNEFRH